MQIFALNFPEKLLHLIYILLKNFLKSIKNLKFLRQSKQIVFKASNNMIRIA